MHQASDCSAGATPMSAVVAGQQSCDSYQHSLEALATCSSCIAALLGLVFDFE
jgi:hypothetical protein